MNLNLWNQYKKDRTGTDININLIFNIHNQINGKKNSAQQVPEGTAWYVPSNHNNKPYVICISRIINDGKYNYNVYVACSPTVVFSSRSTTQPTAPNSRSCSRHQRGLRNCSSVQGGLH